jgi:excinuclease ABC subunit C
MNQLVMDMTQKNAFESLRLELMKEAKSASLLLEAKDLLGLKSIPYRIECFDISNIQGTNPVASMVVCIDGRMEKSQYRRFAIKGKNTPDDFAMMFEAVTRRYSRLMKEEKPMPDLLLIDGGLGQLHAAADALKALDIQIEVSSLAKREELIYILGHEDKPIQLGKFSSVRLLFQKIRDEAHRFAITYHKLLRSKRTLHSILEEVPGIGPATRKKLLKACPDIEAMSMMSPEEICNLGVSLKIAEALLEKLTNSYTLS